MGDIVHPQLEGLRSSKSMHGFGSSLKSSAYVNYSHYLLAHFPASDMLSALHAYSHIASPTI